LESESETAYDRLAASLALLPDAPGIYQMLDGAGAILYIGKAISLRSRVRSYFNESAALGPRKEAMVERIADVRTILVDNEVEALILEANLIKRHQPPFNVRMRDGEAYPYLAITNEPFPRLIYTRTVADDGARYFGPYTDAHGLREVIELLRVAFPLRTCREPIDGRRNRPCLQFHIKRCLAPCVGYQSEPEYDALVADVLLFLEGRQESLLRRMEAEMLEASERLNYEAAARLRDRIKAVRRVAESQKVVWRSRIDMDLIASARSHGQACVQIFLVREGKLLGQEHFLLDGVHEQSDADLYAAFFKQFYTSANIPKEILVDSSPSELPVIERWLSQLKHQRVRVLVPRRGERLRYLELVRENAVQNLKNCLAHQEARESASALSLSELAAALNLPGPPHRIECYDISNIQGTASVASMVVFHEGRAKKSEYRRFKIQYDRGPNDFAMMAETLRRRLRYLRPRDTPASGERFERRPDLLLIDGGKGQLSAVVEVLKELDLWGIPVAGLAKEHEWLFLPDRKEPVILAPGSPALHLVMRIRDEAHRFAIEFHRKLRGKAMTRSILDEIEGIGPARRKRLLQRFGTVKQIAEADADEIAAVRGMTRKLAARLKARLAGEEER
jgi:excinuclease ABC subunit C